MSTVGWKRKFDVLFSTDWDLRPSPDSALPRRFGWTTDAAGVESCQEVDARARGRDGVTMNEAQRVRNRSARWRGIVFSNALGVDL